MPHEKSGMRPACDLSIIYDDRVMNNGDGPFVSGGIGDRNKMTVPNSTIFSNNRDSELFTGTL